MAVLPLHRLQRSIQIWSGCRMSLCNRYRRTETSPLELVRQMQDVMTLRLLIDMYHVHNLREDGGVLRHCMWKKYDRVKINERAQFIVWGFRSAGEWVNWESPFTAPHRREKLTKEEIAAGKNPGVDFFRRSTQLCDVGLFRSRSRTSSRATTQAARSFTQSGAAGPRRSRTDLRAGRAPGRTCPTTRTVSSNGSCEQWHSVPRAGTAPCRQRADDGIARLRYRPRTGLTAAWWAELHENAAEHLARYAEMIPKSTRIAV